MTSLPAASPNPAPPLDGLGAAMRPGLSGSAPGAAEGRWIDRQPLLQLYRFSDAVVAALALVLSYVITNVNHMPKGMAEFLALRLTVKNLLLLAVFAVLWRAIWNLAGLYEWKVLRRPREEMWRVVLACTVGSCCALVFPLISRTGAFDLIAVLSFWVTSVLGSIVARAVARRVSRLQVKMAQEVLIVGSGPRALRVSRQMAEADGRTPPRVVGFVDVEGYAGSEELHSSVLGTLEHLDRIIMERSVDEVLIALPVRSCYSQIQETLEVCARQGVQCTYLGDVFRPALPGRPYRATGDGSEITVRTTPDAYNLPLKRAIDLLGATVLLVVCLPVMLGAAVAIKVTSPGPIFFSQERFGYKRRRFSMHKFRTMVADAEMRQAELEDKNDAGGPVFKMRADPRTTRVGRFLRRTSIDELPQLANILRGEMSLVGPRPLPLRDVRNFSEAWLMRRFSVLPGLTGLWQVGGRSEIGFDQWIALDLKYIDEWSLGLDLRILARTPWAVIAGRGAL